VNLSQNKLLAANLLKCTEIFALHIYGNPMAGSYVDKFCDLLPKVDFSATLDALHEGFDGVRLSSAHVSRLAMKGWNVMQRADSEIQYYTGEPGVTPSTSGKKGDVNHDTEIGIGDIVAITNIMSSDDADEAAKKAADVNGDGEVGIGDIIAITNIMAGE